jgi:glycosyltransferase involved in cell wall biosynthesis
VTTGGSHNRAHDSAAPTGAPLRVLLIIDELDIGGTEQPILELARRLPRRRYTPLVCCFRHGRKAAEIEALGVPVIHLAKRRRVDLGLVRHLIRLMRDERIDIVHTFLIGANLWGRLAALLAGVPTLIASERNVDVWEDPLKRYLGRTLATLTNRVVANAEAVRNYLIARGADAGRVVTIRNGVDFSRFDGTLDTTTVRRSLGIAPEHFLATVVARLEPQKGHDTVIEAAARLRDSHPQLRFLFVGGGSREDALRGAVTRRALTDRIIFAGFRTDSADLVRASDVVVLTSIREGLSNALLEALAAGRPVIASRVGGNAEVVSSDVGILIPPADPSALTDALEQLVEHPERAAQMGRNGHGHVRREFSVTRMVNETVALYEALDDKLPLSRPAHCDLAS